MTPLTSAEKQSRRTADLDAIAQAAEWGTWTRYETAVKSGVVKIAKNPQRSGMANKPFSSKVYRGDLNESGLFVQQAGGPIRVRYDQGGVLWCLDHNCQLSLCKNQKHPKPKTKRH